MARQMTPAHKEAMARARTENSKVQEYLEALQSSGSRRGHRRNPEKMSARIEAIAEDLVTASPIRRVALVQERLDLQADLERQAAQPGLSALEDGFVEVAAAFSARKGITAAAWREVGVPAAVRRRANL